MKTPFMAGRGRARPPPSVRYHASHSGHDPRAGHAMPAAEPKTADPVDHSAMDHGTMDHGAMVFAD